jgi:hypothetical protein
MKCLRLRESPLQRSHRSLQRSPLQRSHPQRSHLQRSHLQRSRSHPQRSHPQRRSLLLKMPNRPLQNRLWGRNY